MMPNLRLRTFFLISTLVLFALISVQAQDPSNIQYNGFWQSVEYPEYDTTFELMSACSDDIFYDHFPVVKDYVTYGSLGESSRFMFEGDSMQCRTDSRYRNIF